jgi:hypothetical protein
VGCGLEREAQGAFLGYATLVISLCLVSPASGSVGSSVLGRPLQTTATTPLSRSNEPNVGIPSSLTVNISVGSDIEHSCPGPAIAHYYGNATGGVPPYTYNWTFGDGSPAGSGQYITHTYKFMGGYNVTLWVNDSHGVSGSQTKLATIIGTCLDFLSIWPEVAVLSAFLALVVITLVVVLRARKKRRASADSPMNETSHEGSTMSRGEGGGRDEDPKGPNED